MEMYFLIRNSDGDTTVTPLTKEQLLKRINEDDGEGAVYLSEIPSNNDTNYWGEKMLIIKGSVVTPKAKETVVEYKID